MNIKESIGVGSFHFIGIGGVGMAAMANILMDLGAKVSGTDLVESNNSNSLLQRGAEIKIGNHDEANLPNNTVIVVISSAVAADNPELLLAKKRKITIYRRGEFLALLGECFEQTIAVSGSHGKTTTTAMVAHALNQLGYNAGYMVGGSVISWERSGFAGDGKYFVTEIDESDGTQQFFKSECALILNIEDDHSWSAGGEEKLFASFVSVAKNSKQVYAWPGEYPNKLLSNLENVKMLKHNEIPMTLELPQVGDHNLMNAWAAVQAVCKVTGRDESEVISSLRNFPGVARRMTTHAINVERDLILVEDYAHHPTELRCTLEALRGAYVGKKLCVVFQPHRYERVKRYGEEFANELKLAADQVIIVSPFAAWVADKDLSDPRQLSRALNCAYFSLDEGSFKELSQLIKGSFASSNAVWAIIGAGDVTKVLAELKESF